MTAKTKMQTQITLNRASHSDIEFIVNAETSDDNAEFIGQWHADQHAANLKDANYIYLIISSVLHDTRLGYVILEGATDKNSSLNIKRIVVLQKGNGVGRATIKLIKKLAFDDLGIHRLWLDVKTFNHRAKHLYETEGFKIEGTLRDCIKRGEHYESLTVLSILKPEYINDQFQ